MSQLPYLDLHAAVEEVHAETDTGIRRVLEDGSYTDSASHKVVEAVLACTA